jgi:hypothetical protein
MVRQESEAWRFVSRMQTSKGGGNPRGRCNFCSKEATINAGAWFTHLKCCPGSGTLDERQAAALAEAKTIAGKELDAVLAKQRRKQAQNEATAAAAAAAVNVDTDEGELDAAGGGGGGGGSAAGSAGAGSSATGHSVMYGPLASAFANTEAYKADKAIARCFFANGLPLRLADDKFFKEMVKAIQNTKASYVPPHRHKLTQKDGLLAKETAALKRKQDQLLQQDKDKYGLTIVSDGFTDAARRPLINVVLLSPRGEYFVEAIDTSGQKKTMEYIAEKVRRCHQ